MYQTRVDGRLRFRIRCHLSRHRRQPLLSLRKVPRSRLADDHGDQSAGSGGGSAPPSSFQRCSCFAGTVVSVGDEVVHRVFLEAASLCTVAWSSDGRASVRLVNDTAHLR